MGSLVAYMKCSIANLNFEQHLGLIASTKFNERTVLTIATCSRKSLL